MKTTAYYELAERIACDINGIWFCCNKLPREEAVMFSVVFMPTYEERMEYSHDYTAWMGCNYTTREEDNNLRILALLFMHELTKE